MYGVFYAGVSEQPCLRVKVSARAGEKLEQMCFTPGATRKGVISGAALYHSEVPFFSTRPAQVGQQAEATLLAKRSAVAGEGKMVFRFKPLSLAAGEHYFWLVYDVAPAAKGGAKVEALLESAVDGAGRCVTPPRGKNGSCRADGRTAARPGVVYPFKYRIAPYVRPKWVCLNNKGLLTAEHLKCMTDLIVFGYTHEGTALRGAHDAVHGQMDFSDECLQLARTLRGRGKARLLAGFSCNERNNPMAGLLYDEPARRELARQVAALVLEKGYEGIDIDWEYPRENSRYNAKLSWRKFAFFLAELREELAGTGASLSIAVTTRYDAPNQEVLDGVDFINSMSYGRPGEHSTKKAAQADVDYLVKQCRVPPVKVVLGLPFFSRDTKPKHTDQGGHGYSTIIGWFPGLPAGRNTFQHPTTGERHFFNGAELIKDKCRAFVLQQGIGGVCIWAYDTDVPLSHPKSLSKALYTIIKQAER